MKDIVIGDTREVAIERADYPPDRVNQILAGETVAVVGYGVQGRGQSLNMRDSGVKVIVGQRQGGKAYDLCLRRRVEARARRCSTPRRPPPRAPSSSTCSRDAGQKDMWPKLKPHLTAGKALYFSARLLDRVPRADRRDPVQADIDVILCAPKGSGTTVRRHFLEGKGINSSASPSSRTRPGGRASGAWRSESPSARGTCSRRRSKRKWCQRPDRRAWRADGRDLRPVASPVRGAAGERALARARRSTRRWRRRPRACTR